MYTKHKIMVKTRQSKGFSLVVVLALLSVFAGVMTGIVASRQGDSMRNEAEIAGWEAAKLARASRVYVRNLLATTPNLSAILDVAGSGPQDISIGTLISLSLLPNDFARQDGGEFFNALGQRIRVIMANFPVDGNPADITTVPTAYVYFENNNKSNISIVQDVVQSVRREGVAVSAPVFNGAVNMSGNCNGLGPAVIIWDTGCMSDTEFTALTGNTYAQGDFVTPSWRSVNFDSRALMRFPQPENTGLPTMLTELEMGNPDPTDTKISILEDSGSQTTDIVMAQSDDAATMTDHRRDIIGVQDVQAVSIIANTQSGGDVFVDNGSGTVSSRGEEIFALFVTGNVTAQGSGRIFNGDTTVSGLTTVDRNITVTQDGAAAPVTAFVDNIRVGDALSTNFTVEDQPNIGGEVSAGTMNVNVPTNVTGSFIAETLQMSGANADQITVSGDANMLGTTTSVNTVISGAQTIGNHQYITGVLNADEVDVAGDFSVGSSVAVAGAASVNQLIIHNASNSAECVGDCPPRTLSEWCQNITGMSYQDCMDAFQ